MAFPTSPSDGQTTIINGVTYVYNSTYRSWTRQSQSLTTLTVSGNITTSSGNFIGNGALLTGLPAGYANTNVASYLPTYSGNISAGNLSVTTNVSVTGNLSASYVLGNGSQLTGLPATYSNTNVASYLPTYSGNLGGTLTTAAQPYITAVGTLGSLSVTGNISAGNANLGSTTTTTTLTANTISAIGSILTYSLYLGGASYITVPGTGSALLGAGDYTIEFFTKTADTSWEIFAASAGGMAIFIAGGSFYYQYAYGVAGPITTSASSILDNQWHHVALVRRSGTVTAYFDGVSQASASDSTDYSAQTGTYFIGYGNQSAGRYLTGYLSNFRVVNGTAVYTANFTPPTGPLTAIANTSLLTFQNASLIDNSTVNRTLGNVGAYTLDYNVIPFSGYGPGGTITASGNITGGNILLSGNLVDTNALSIITGASGNITLAPNGTSVVVATTTGANVTGTFNATGNITGNFFLGNGSQLTGITTGASNARAVGFSLVFGG